MSSTTNLGGGRRVDAEAGWLSALSMLAILLVLLLSPLLYDLYERSSLLPH